MDNEEEILAWGWYAMTVTAKQFISTVPFRKIRLRQLNMAVGDLTYFDNLYKKDADAPYFIGEIYVVHPQIEPTTGREGLVDNTYKKIFEHKVKDLFEKLNKEYNELSKLGCQVLDPLATSMRQLRMENRAVEVNLKTIEETKDARTKYTKALNDAKAKLADYLTKVRKNGRITDLVVGIVEHYQELSDSEVEKYNKQKEVQKANAVIKKITLSNEIKKIMGEKDTTNLQHSEEKFGGGNADDNEKQPQSQEKKDNGDDTSKAPSSEFDVYKGLTSLEKAVIKKVYKILDGQKNLDSGIREMIKAKMVKKLTK